MSQGAEEYKKVIRARLSDERYIHSLNVAYCAKELAEKYGADPQKAYDAGLLHDSCKDLPKIEQLQYLKQNHIELTPTELAAPKLFHAICGTVFAEKELGVTDPEILSAIRYHTTGKAGMTLLQKIVFIADFISADRDYPGVNVMRKKAAKSLDSAIIEGLSFTIRELVENERPVHTDTVEAYNDAVIQPKIKEK